MRGGEELALWGQACMYRPRRWLQTCALCLEHHTSTFPVLLGLLAHGKSWQEAACALCRTFEAVCRQLLFGAGDTEEMHTLSHVRAGTRSSLS